jgi:hypothetical protein
MKPKLENTTLIFCGIGISATDTPDKNLVIKKVRIGSNASFIPYVSRGTRMEINIV